MAKNKPSCAQNNYGDYFGGSARTTGSFPTGKTNEGAAKAVTGRDFTTSTSKGRQNAPDHAGHDDHTGARKSGW